MNAPNNFLKTLKETELCTLQAEWAEIKRGAVPLALDAAGFIPGESQTVAAALMLGGFGSIVDSAVEQDWAGASIGATGIATAVTGLAAEQMGMTWAKAVPLVGYGVNIIGTAYDLYRTISTGYQAYKGCVSQP